MAKAWTRTSRRLAALAMVIAVGGPARAADTIVNPFGVFPPGARETFYTRDQGSRLMPVVWFKALRRPDGQKFLADGLSRYGYLPSPFSNDLPLGFTVGPKTGPVKYVGMTCGACHTRRLEAGPTSYLVEGGPAIVDLRGFMADLDVAVRRTLADTSVFDAFAAEVLGPSPSPSQKALLRTELTAWDARNHELVTRALPPTVDWGYGRADAIQMIFNRLTGLDIGTTADGVIAENIHVADAPARYPFLWEADKGDRTQWMAFAPNGNPILGYLRNLGQSLGVFAHFRPRKLASGSVDYSDNSVDTMGLFALEAAMSSLAPPKWPFPRTPEERAAAVRGERVYYSAAAGCAGCHERKGMPLFPIDVGTDTRQLQLLTRLAKTGVLEGESFAGPPKLRGEDNALTILKIAVAKTAAPTSFGGATPLATPAFVQEQIEQYKAPSPTGYEARSLRGVWAAAPFLHNGSVASLEDLLRPAALRTPTFDIGAVYDPKTAGLATKQPKPLSTMKTTGCDQLNSGNSRCGHEFGTTTLTDDQKKDLLEFLKEF